MLFLFFQVIYNFLIIMKGENKATNHRKSPNHPDNEKTLITNLPLLFANGKPVSLDKITLVIVFVKVSYSVLLTYEISFLKIK